MNKTSFLSRSAWLVLLASLGTACQQPSAANTNAALTAPAAAPAATQNPEDAMPRVSVEEAKAAVAKGEAVIIDVRGPDAYKMAHIKDALDFGLARLEKGDFEGLPKDKRIIAYCSCPTEHTSARSAYLLQKAGFKNAGALLGGNAAWEASGGEMVKAPPASPSPATAAAPGAQAQPANPATKAKAAKK